MSTAHFHQLKSWSKVSNQVGDGTDFGDSVEHKRRFRGGELDAQEAQQDFAQELGEEEQVLGHKRLPLEVDDFVGGAGAVGAVAGPGSAANVAPRLDVAEPSLQEQSKRGVQRPVFQRVAQENVQLLLEVRPHRSGTKQWPLASSAPHHRFKKTVDIISQFKLMSSCYGITGWYRLSSSRPVMMLGPTLLAK